MPLNPFMYGHAYMHTNLAVLRLLHKLNSVYSNVYTYTYTRTYMHAYLAVLGQFHQQLQCLSYQQA
jgi:hypothetical protein